MGTRARLSQTWTNYRWPLIVTVGALAMALGYVGYDQWRTGLHERDPENFPAPGVLDITFDTMSLFVLGSAQGTGMPLILQIARLLAPLAVGVAALTALFSLFRDQLPLLWIPAKRGHVVLCGLGHVGAEFLAQLDRKRVVVIEADPANPNRDLCRTLRIPVIIGDAQQEQTLRYAKVDQADRLIALGPSDAVNAEIVSIASRLAANKSGHTLHCQARISDLGLCTLLRLHERNLAEGFLSSTMEFFNLDDISARMWLLKNGIPAEETNPHVLVSRLDGLGSWLVVLAAARWCADRLDDTKLWVTVVDDDGPERIRALCLQYPGVQAVCQFEFCSTSINKLRDLEVHLARQQAPALTSAYVTAATDEQALEIALTLRQHLSSDIPISVEMWRTSGVGRLITAAQAHRQTNLTLFPSLKAACTREFVRGESFRYTEPIAIAIHGHWRELELQRTGVPAKPWEDIDELLKESNRAQARDIRVKLAKIGCTVTNALNSPEPEFVFTVQEVDDLARDEHKRWVRERVEAGWQPVETEAEKDPDRKKTPYLVPYDLLPAEVAEYDRAAVRAIPAILASTDHRVIRT